MVFGIAEMAMVLELILYIIWLCDNEFCVGVKHTAAVIYSGKSKEYHSLASCRLTLTHEVRIIWNDRIVYLLWFWYV